MFIRDFMDEVKEIYNEKFPNSKCVVHLTKNLGSAIFIDCFFANSLDEEPNRITGNDMFKIGFVIHLNRENENDDLGTQTMTAMQSVIAIKPSNRYVAFDTVKIPYRKTTGDAQKLLLSFKKYVARLYDITKDNYESGNFTEYWDRVATDGNKFF